MSLCQLSPEASRPSSTASLSSTDQYHQTSCLYRSEHALVLSEITLFIFAAQCSRYALLSRGAILLEFELAPPLKEEPLSRSNTFKQKAKHQFSPDLGSGPTTFEVHGLLGHSKPLVDLTN